MRRRPRLAQVVERSTGDSHPLDRRLLLIARALAGETFPADVVATHRDLAGDQLFRQWFTTRFQQSINDFAINQGFSGADHD
jgi:hypothetical protein